ncbi:Aste57867_5978 [Aphanomyces stellatus]|uniref:Aste57867_3732 protein n=1 Tax=Aphanomyces stellatus TaxID=120398 RepID=A0A485KE78_9STRA|nr:hypothetical protein As57867_005963 [Aphanomyces stellatus]KAF0709346.1 hypothetical protein As57867_005964 [Aphanomyces stellatus]KAF0714722.1 hypothetical protein As57867_003721 [Aphanomyces stellatus]KAF0719516.1 hypothetical protein As57867_000986 [Aphanomyces stellatus]VFT78209.1 Aste57867_987 [Aphanomyces stellatus]
MLTALLLVAAALPLTLAQNLFQGRGTSHSFDHGKGNCGFTTLPQWGNYVAMNGAQWNGGLSCSACVNVRCVDPICKNHFSQTAYVIDSCKGCKYGSLDLANNLFDSITGLSWTDVAIEWSWVDCPVDNNNINFCLNKGANPSWYAIQPLHGRQSVRYVKINGFSTSQVGDTYFFLANANGQQVPLNNVKVELTFWDWSVLTKYVSLQPGQCTNGQWLQSFTNTDEDLELAQNATEPLFNDPTPAVTTPSPAPLNKIDNQV